MGILAPSIYLFASPSLSHALGVSNSNKIACERMLKSLPTHIHTYTHTRTQCGVVVVMVVMVVSVREAEEEKDTLIIVLE